MNLSADRIITVGSLKMTLPALVNTITALLVGMFVSYKGQPAVGITAMLTMLVNSYTINCTVVGHCNVWAWTLALLAAFSVALALFTGKFPGKK
jgi:hypothetical protein